MVASIANCVFLVIKVKVDSNNQLVHFGSWKLLRESTFIDFYNSSDEDENFGIGSNVFNACEWEIVVSQRPSETHVLVSPTLASVMHNVMDLLKSDVPNLAYF
jgi:hypothetical protein